MLNDTTKKKINSLRQILVGKVPDPKSQVDQITNALIYKYMDDMDRQAEAFGGKAAFFVGEYEKYSWRKLMDPRLGGQDRLNLYVEALDKMSQNKNLSPIFRQILRGAFLPYRSPETLNLFLSEVDGFAYEHSEELGNAYEYLLSIMGSQGDAGQFRTPRHIIDFIVDVIDPKKGDRILDPACGTAGFLISAYKHIIGNHDGMDNVTGKKTNKEERLTPEEMKSLHRNFTGYDIDPGMTKLARVNMFLHNFPEPKIQEYDTLSDDSHWGDRYEVILANPPFMSPKGGIIPHKRFSISATRAEVLFVDYIVEHLTTKGRAGIIVPEGIIFQSGTAYKQLRKQLVEDGLFAVVSLPSGVFNPYAGVKTSILLFDAEVGKRQADIVFVKVGNDGYDLGAQRREIANNDLPEAAEILKAWRKGERKESPLATWVSREKIAESDDYNLSGDRYRIATDYSNAKWPMVELGGIISSISPEKKIQKSEYLISGIYPIIDQSQEYISGYTNDHEAVISLTKPVVIFGDHTCAIKYSDKPFAQGADGIKILETNDNLLPSFLYHFLRANPVVSDGYKRHYSKLKTIKLPLPPIEVQERIVAELDGYQNIISGARQVVKNWKPKIDIDPQWEKVKIGEVCETTSGGTPLKSKSEYYDGGNIPWLRSGEVAQGFVKESELFITEKGLKNSSAKLMPIDTVLVAMYGATAGQVGILKFESATNQAVCGILPNSRFVPEYLFQSLKDQKNIMLSFAGGGAQPNISQGVIRNLEITLPPLAIQKQIVEKIESERALVESNKKLIVIYEQKMKDVIAKLWNE